MKDKNVYLTIGIIVMLAIATSAGLQYLGIVNFFASSPTPTPKPLLSPTASPLLTPSPTSNPLATVAPTPIPTASPPGATPIGLVALTFTAAGLDSSANGTVVATSMGNITAPQLPYTMDVDVGTTVTYSFQANVSTTVTDCLFQLSSAPAQTSITAATATTINATYGRAIIDYSGTLVQLPAYSQINRIADDWAAHNTIVVMCGDGNDLVATTSVDTTITMFQYILPAIATMSTPWSSSGTPNMEQLLADNPNIVFYSYSASTQSAVQTMTSAGLCVVQMYFATFPDMLTTVEQTGWILGPTALAKADAYVTYFNSALANVTAVTPQIPQSQQLTVYHCSGTSPLYCDGGNTLIDTWITTCGGINAAESVSGNQQEITLEQLLSFNPQVILVGSASAVSIVNTIMTNPQYATLSAVENNKVIANPMGVFDWSRYSVEEALNIQWVAQTLYPKLFPNLNMASQTEYFYQTFYGYTLSNDQVQAILNNTTPPPT